ncbi:MAG: gliding motility-associated ABC transporter substrate-binding protein GldG [Paludibacteraceae bacterium]|nr:gliding motility-associated ABC transporter substrate-binding protein GldG [Paludibacteraceae bacterium]
MLLNIAVQFMHLRLDLTQDKRHTLSTTTKQLCHSLNDHVEVVVYLQGSVNSGFMQLENATRNILKEMSLSGNLTFRFVNPNDLSDSQQQALIQSLQRHNLHPAAIYETAGNARRSETIVYPFALVRKATPKNSSNLYSGKWVSLLENRRDLSGAENLNRSAESLEYKFALALRTLEQQQPDRILFLEGQGELPEQNTQDVQSLLAQHFDIYRGALTPESDCLNSFSAVIIADPQRSFSEADKYILDQYLMQGGSLLWLVNGVRFSEQVLEDEGFTPALALDVNLTDMLFRYGVRINPHLLQDLQCLSVPVDVSRNADQPQWQPMPWTYAPLLQSSNLSPVTANLSPVSATFCSDLTAVGDDPDIRHNILLASSQNSRITLVPGEVNLNEISQDPRLFNLSYLPVAMSLEGRFLSLFEHRLTPESVVQKGDKLTVSTQAKQIVVASGSVISNDLQQGQPLPAGYDRYSRMQFANRDFVLNSVLWLSGYADILSLRQKTIPLRMLNKTQLQSGLTLSVTLSLILPLLILAIAGVTVQLLRKHRYTS